MTPEQLAAKGTESGQQKALFAWAAIARMHGFAVADDMRSYVARPPDAQHAYLIALGGSRPVPELRWMHSVPNGGARDIVTATRMKAEGVKRGVPDVFLPVAMYREHGLYIEMKKPDGGRQSDEQKEFAAHCSEYGFAYYVCDTWRDAANTVRHYLTRS